jgi:hypothetical protein
MTILNEWANVQLPHFGSTGMRQIAALQVGPGPTSIDLRTVFRGSKGGSGFPYFLTIKADMAPQPTGYPGGGKFYFAMAANGASGITQGVGGVSGISRSSMPGVSFPLSDGQEIRGRTFSQEVRFLGTTGMSGTGGYATMVSYPFIHYMAGGGGGSSGFAPSGFLRIYGSSVPEGQIKNNFPAP